MRQPSRPSHQRSASARRTLSRPIMADRESMGQSAAAVCDARCTVQAATSASAWPSRRSAACCNRPMEASSSGSESASSRKR